MAKIELSSRLYDIMNTYCHDDIADNGASLDDMRQAVIDDPFSVISSLMEIIERLAD